MAGTRKTSGTSTAFGGSALPGVPGIAENAVTSDINVTPMVDVMLVLLIIFMVVTPIFAAYEVMVPEARHVVPEPDGDVIELGIDANGVYYVDKEPVAADQLAALLRQLYAARPGDHLIYLRADRNVGYSVVLDGIDAARAAGVRTIGAISEPMVDEPMRRRTGAATGPDDFTLSDSRR